MEKNELELNIPKMVCDGCIKNITNGLEKIGLSDINFDLANKNIKISGNDLNEKEILKTLKRIDYPAQVV